MRYNIHKAKQVYGLSSIKQATKWMRMVCVYTVKSTWIKVTKAGNILWWTMLTESNVKECNLTTSKTIKDDMNQTRNTLRSTNVVPITELYTVLLNRKTAWDIYTKVYNAREPIFFDETGPFLKSFLWGNTYIMMPVDTLTDPAQPHRNSQSKGFFPLFLLTEIWGNSIWGPTDYEILVCLLGSNVV